MMMTIMMVGGGILSSLSLPRLPCTTTTGGVGVLVVVVLGPLQEGGPRRRPPPLPLLLLRNANVLLSQLQKQVEGK